MPNQISYPTVVSQAPGSSTQGEWVNLDNIKIEDGNLAGTVFSRVSNDLLHSVCWLEYKIPTGVNTADLSIASKTLMFYDHPHNWLTLLTPTIVNSIDFGVSIQYKNAFDSMETYKILASGFSFSIPVNAINLTCIVSVKELLRFANPVYGNGTFMEIDVIKMTITYELTGAFTSIQSITGVGSITL